MDDVKAMLDKIQAGLAELRKQYEFFFLGTRRTEPMSERRALEEMIRKFGQRRITNTIDQFRFNSLQGSYFSLANLWARTVRDIEEGRVGRDAPGTATRPTPQAEAAPGNGPVADPGHIEQVVARLLEARRECGIETGEQDADAVREALLSRARQIAAACGDERTVEFKVVVEDGKPKIKATTR